MLTRTGHATGTVWSTDPTREGAVVDDLFHDECGVESLNAGEGVQLLVVELLEMPKICGENGRR